VLLQQPSAQHRRRGLEWLEGKRVQASPQESTTRAHFSSQQLKSLSAASSCPPSLSLSLSLVGKCGREKARSDCAWEKLRHEFMAVDLPAAVRIVAVKELP